MSITSGSTRNPNSNNNEKHIDVTRSNYSVVDNEFDSMRERFENEMHRVEDEMQRLRREFECYKPSGGANTDLLSKPIISNSLNDKHYGDLSTLPNNNFRNSRPLYDPHLDNLKSPLIKDDSDGKTLRLRFDVAQYKPEEVTVKTIDNRLFVHAKHEEKTPSKTIFREYNQEFMLPRGTNPELISSTLSTDGVLTVEAPLPQLALKN